MIPESDWLDKRVGPNNSKFGNCYAKLEFEIKEIKTLTDLVKKFRSFLEENND